MVVVVVLAVVVARSNDRGARHEATSMEVSIKERAVQQWSAHA